MLKENRALRERDRMTIRIATGSALAAAIGLAAVTGFPQPALAQTVLKFAWQLPLTNYASKGRNRSPNACRRDRQVRLRSRPFRPDSFIVPGSFMRRPAPVQSTSRCSRSARLPQPTRWWTWSTCRSWCPASSGCSKPFTASGARSSIGLPTRPTSGRWRISPGQADNSAARHGHCASPRISRD